jgi:exosortase
MCWTALALVVPCAWAFLPTASRLVQTWAATAEYSHGFLIPVVAACLLYHRRSHRAVTSSRGSWWGLALLGLAGGLLLAGASARIDYLGSVALLPALAGFVLLVGGWPALRWSWPVIVFLLFMLPLPARLVQAVSGPLGTVATQGSGYALQALGVPVVIEGHTLLLKDHQLTIDEAGNGLGLILVVAAIASAVAIVSNRPALDRILLALSAILIGIVVNGGRIAVTALACPDADRGWGEVVFHHLAGCLVTPLALVLLWLEVRLIDVVLVPSGPTGKENALALPHLGSLLLPQNAPPQATSVTGSPEEASGRPLPPRRPPCQSDRPHG